MAENSIAKMVVNDLRDEVKQLQAENKKLKEDAKEDFKEIERLRGLVSQLCEERIKALKGE